MSEFSPKSVLVYVGGETDNALGENLIKLPFLMALRNQWPKARLTWIPGRGPAMFEGPLARIALPLVDELITDLDLPREPLDLIGYPTPLPDRHFDVVIDTQRIFARTLALRKISHGIFISGTWRFVFSDRPPVGPRRRSPRLIDKLLILLDAAVGEPVAAPVVAPIPDAEREAAEALLPSGPVYVGIAPGAGNQSSGKVWPLERFIELGLDQANKGRTPVFVLGPSEADWRDRIADPLPQALFPLQQPLPGDTPMTPALTIALARQFAAGVANCSGTGHMIALGGTPMVSLFAPSRPEKYAPHVIRGATLRAQDFGSRQIEAIPTKAVIDAVDSLLDR